MASTVGYQLPVPIDIRIMAPGRILHLCKTLSLYMISSRIVTSQSTEIFFNRLKKSCKCS